MAEANTVEEVSEDIVAIKTMIENGSYKIVEKRKGKTEVWKVLGEIEKTDGIIINNIVACKFCKNVLKFSGKQTTNLLRHKCYIKMKEAEENQLSLIKVDEQSRSKCLRACMNWSIQDCRPFLAVDGQGFKETVAYFLEVGEKYGRNVDIDHLIPHPTKISRNLNEMAAQYEEDLKGPIHSHIKSGAAVTSDIWTDNCAKRSYITATLHYVDEECYNVKCILFVKCIYVM